MANGNTITIIGNVTRDPELRYLTSGTALASFGVAWNNRYKDRNGQQVEDTSFFDVTCWRQLAENIAECRHCASGRTLVSRLGRPDGVPGIELVAVSARVRSRAGAKVRDTRLD